MGPSGSGKGVVMQYLKRTFPDAVFPVSCTTRSPRPGERDGEVYYFVSREEFKKKIHNGEFLEYAVVHHDNYYGTLKKQIVDALEDGKMVIREVDMQGVASIREKLGRENTCAVFLTVPSWDVLKERITRRHPENNEEMAKREESFKKEMEFAKTCDYVIASREGEQDRMCQKVAEIIRRRS